MLVTSVEPDSSAFAQGVRPGWAILKIGHTDLAPIVTKLNATYAASSLRDLMLRRAILGRLEGNAAGAEPVEFLNAEGRHVRKTLAPGQPKGVRVQFGYLNPMQVWFNSSRVGDGNIGYVAFNIFLDAQRLMTSFGDAVQSCEKCEGFIVDLRGNPGGIGIMAMGMAGWFIAQPDQKLGTLYMRDTTLKFVVNPRLTTFAGPLAILVDGASASTSEIMAEGLKDLGRARIFGTRTAAAALPSVFEKLPNGDGFQYAIANYVSEGGQAAGGPGGDARCGSARHQTGSAGGQGSRAGCGSQVDRRPETLSVYGLLVEHAGDAIAKLGRDPAAIAQLDLIGWNRIADAHRHRSAPYLS